MRENFRVSVHAVSRSSKGADWIRFFLLEADSSLAAEDERKAA